MVNVVKITLYSGKDCELCEPTEELLKTLVELSRGKISLEIKEVEDKEEIKKMFDVERLPIILIGDNGEVRYTGAPLGQEGWALLETIVTMSTRDVQISEEYLEKLRNLEKSIRIETIITPACPYCPYAVLIANKIAIASNGKVISDVIEAHEFPEIAEKFEVMAVPTVILSTEPYQGKVFSIGVPKEKELIEKIIEMGTSETQ